MDKETKPRYRIEYLPGDEIDLRFFRPSNKESNFSNYLQKHCNMDYCDKIMNRSKRDRFQFISKI